MALLEAVVRRFTAALGHSEATTAARLTTKLSVAMAQVESEYAEICRSGRMFTGIGSTTGTPPAASIPTTAPQAFLWNNDPRKTYTLIDVSAMILQGTPSQGATLFGIVSPAPGTGSIPLAGTGSLIANWSGGGLSSKAVFAGSLTIPAPAGNAQWGILPGQGGNPTYGTPAAGVGQLINADVRGRVMIPPGKGLGISVFAGAGTAPLFIPSATWYEAEEDLE